jgi:hypothetical protein
MIDNVDLKNLDLLYITRCTDGTFALCMDSSPSPGLPPPPPLHPIPLQLPVVAPTASIKKINKSPDANTTPKPVKRKSRPKKIPNKDIIMPEEKCHKTPLPPSLSSMVPVKSLIHKEKQANVFVLMKHRRCYSIIYPPCLHSLILEYNICREHTIRHMCHTQKISNRRKYKRQTSVFKSIDAVASCLKSIVNSIVNKEENRLVMKKVHFDFSFE